MGRLQLDNCGIWALTARWAGIKYSSHAIEFSLYANYSRSCCVCNRFPSFPLVLHYFRCVRNTWVSFSLVWNRLCPLIQHVQWAWIYYADARHLNASTRAFKTPMTGRTQCKMPSLCVYAVYINPCQKWLNLTHGDALPWSNMKKLSCVGKEKDLCGTP